MLPYGEDPVANTIGFLMFPAEFHDINSGCLEEQGKLSKLSLCIFSGQVIVFPAKLAKRKTWMALIPYS